MRGSGIINVYAENLTCVCMCLGVHARVRLCRYVGKGRVFVHLFVRLRGKAGCFSSSFLLSLFRFSPYPTNLGASPSNARPDSR